jgi:endonuclease YncB( thermonuclease family)
MLAALALASAFLCANAVQIDGDTLKCASGEHVRLWGVNSPEAHDPGGPEATRALSRLVFGKTLSCQRKGRSFNRTVALCYLNGHDIAAEMVRGGWAVDWPKYSHGRYAKP